MKNKLHSIQYKEKKSCYTFQIKSFIKCNDLFFLFFKILQISYD